MNCWHCERPSVGVCRFCGRALCKDHVQLKPYIVSAYIDDEGREKVIAVNNTLFCGVCDPRPEPIRLDEVQGE